MFLNQGSKFSRKVECESEAKAKFFSKKNAKRKRSEFASPQCEKMRIRNANLDPCLNLIILVISALSFRFVIIKNLLLSFIQEA
jgi:hypothetical protein